MTKLKCVIINPGKMYATYTDGAAALGATNYLSGDAPERGIVGSIVSKAKHSANSNTYIYLFEADETKQQYVAGFGAFKEIEPELGQIALDASEQFHADKTTDPSWNEGYTEEKLSFEIDAELEVKIGNPKYDKTIVGKYGSSSCTVDVYRVLEAFKVTNPQLQHLVKKALNVGVRGHKDERQDLLDIVHSAQSALDMFDDINGVKDES